MSSAAVVIGALRDKVLRKIVADDILNFYYYFSM